MNTFVSEVIFYNQYGEGVVFQNKKPFYVFGVIIGEIVNVEKIEEFEKYGYAKLINIIKKSKNRINHNIQNAHLIGGYELIHMNDEEQKKFKTNQVINDFKKNTNYNLENIEWFQGKQRTKYRNKITLHDGCFYKKNTNNKIDIDDFLLSNIKWDKNLKGDVIYRQLDTLIYGTKDDISYTTDTLLNYKFRVGLNSFYQVNKEVTEYAYNQILNNIIPNENTLDLFCGIGTIGIILSQKSTFVLGIEINKNSYQDALYNREINKIKNIDFLNQNVDEFIKNNKKKFANVILDPARYGVDKKTLKIIDSELKPQRIIYMSCNPSTQSADFNHLKNNYVIKKFFIMDMFPQTRHIETLMILERKSKEGSN